MRFSLDVDPILSLVIILSCTLPGLAKKMSCAVSRDTIMYYKRIARWHKAWRIEQKAAGAMRSHRQSVCGKNQFV